MTVVEESPRVQALRRYCAPDAPAEPELEAVLRTAATVAGVPTATINLLDDEVQQQYCTVGFEGGTAPRSESMCHVTVVEGRAQHVPDATADERFARNPWVDGRLGEVRFYASSPLVTPDGFVIGTLCVFDTVVRELSDAQRQALDDLAGQVMALLERRRLAREAEAATEAKSRFVASVSHEIRTPLNGVLGMLDLLLASDLNPDQQRQATLAKRSGETLLALLDGVLDLSKGEAGHVVLREVPFDPVALVEDVVEVLSALTTRHGTTLSARVEGEPSRRVVGDPDRLRQVVVNLTGNALKFTTEGSVTVVVGGTAGDLRVEVRDTGEGIAPEELATLFRPFAQGASGSRHGGTGLGLSICAELVGLMGGTLTCDSELGVGTTMTVAVSLPVAPEDEGPAGAGLRVLVVDDDLVNQAVAVGLLEAAGASAEAVGDGETAVERVRDGAYDLVLLDYELPGMDGAQTARAVRELPSDVRMLAVTGHTEGEQVDACLAAGAAGALVKPLRPADLDAALRQVRRRTAGADGA
jgi:two-component system, sensor histidine kinase